MTEKIIDAEKNLMKIRKSQTRIRKKMREIVKEEKKREKLENNLRKKTNKHKENIKKKNEEKLAFLKKKYKQESLTKSEEEARKIMPGLKCFEEDENKEEDMKTTITEEDILVVELPEEKGSIKLSKEELSILTMQPGYMVLGDMKDEEMELELAAMGTTIIWEISSKQKEKKEAEEEEIEEEELPPEREK